MNTVLNLVYESISESGEAIKNNDGLKKLADQTSDIYIELDKSINTEQKEKLSKLWFAEANSQYEVGLAYYKAGFKAALLLAIECLTEK